MLFNFLKLFRLDVSAMMDSVKAGLDLRFEQAKDGFSQMAVQVAVITTLLVFAAIAGAGAFGVALLALYQWTAEEAGVYAGLGAVGAALIVAATILAIAADNEEQILRSDRKAVRCNSHKNGDVRYRRRARCHQWGCKRVRFGFTFLGLYNSWRPQMQPPAISWSQWPSSWRRL